MKMHSNAENLPNQTKFWIQQLQDVVWYFNIIFTSTLLHNVL